MRLLAFAGRLAIPVICIMGLLLSPSNSGGGRAIRGQARC